MSWKEARGSLCLLTLSAVWEFGETLADNIRPRQRIVRSTRRGILDEEFRSRRGSCPRPRGKTRLSPLPLGEKDHQTIERPWLGEQFTLSPCGGSLPSPARKIQTDRAR